MRTLILFLLTFSLGLMVNLNVSAQNLKWKLGTSPIIQTTAINDKGTIFFARPNDMKFYAVKPDGSPKWINSKLGPTINSCPAIGPKGNINIGGRDAKICSIQWCYQCEAKLSSTQAIAQDGTVYVNPYNKKLYAINPDGTKKWIFEHSGYRIGSSPSIGKDGTIYLADMSLYAINSNGHLNWKYSPSLNGFEYAPAIGPDGTIYVGSSFDGSIHALSPQKKVKWVNKSESSSGIHSTPAIGSDGTIYVSRLIANKPNALHAINPNGNTKWKTEIKSNIIFSPTVGKDNTIYVGAMYKPENRGKGPSAIYAISPDDGSIKWKYTFDVTMSGKQPTPTIAPDGTLYVGALYAIQTHSKGLANSSWPMFHHDQKNTGRINDSPTPKIKANSSDKPIKITSADNLSITIEFSTGDHTGDNADWWLLAETDYGWFHYEVESNTWAPDIAPSFQGPLFNFDEFSVLNATLPAGTYTVYFGVDMDMNGVLDMDQAYYDSMTVNILDINVLEQACIQSGGTVTTKDCCDGVKNFPNLCLIGACGCPPDGENIVKICSCGPGKCFDGEKCVERE